MLYISQDALMCHRGQCAWNAAAHLVHEHEILFRCPMRNMNRSPQHGQAMICAGWGPCGRGQAINRDMAGDCPSRLLQYCQPAGQPVLTILFFLDSPFCFCRRCGFVVIVRPAQDLSFLRPIASASIGGSFARQDPRLFGLAAVILAAAPPRSPEADRCDSNCHFRPSFLSSFTQLKPSAVRSCYYFSTPTSTTTTLSTAFTPVDLLRLSTSVCWGRGESGPPETLKVDNKGNRLISHFSHSRP